jgi:hypothetical protein
VQQRLRLQYANTAYAYASAYTHVYASAYASAYNASPG